MGWFQVLRKDVGGYPFPLTAINVWVMAARTFRLKDFVTLEQTEIYLKQNSLGLTHIQPSPRTTCPLRTGRHEGKTCVELPFVITLLWNEEMKFGHTPMLEVCWRVWSLCSKRQSDSLCPAPGTLPSCHNTRQSVHGGEERQFLKGDRTSRGWGYPGVFHWALCSFWNWWPKATVLHPFPQNAT